ncbi:MAG: hypothetical protein E6G44_11240 [Actinobacteria bacterium]|nr:MAG: hypothetical protein E6G44_11240 [Actinomycetota bacterium]
MRLAWFSPLPPIPSGIADYTAELLPFLTRLAEVDVYCPRPGLVRSVSAPSGVEVLPPRRFRRRAEGYDAVFYHLGNNPYHAFVYRAALASPGVAVLHEFVLHHLVDFVLFGEGRRKFEAYARLLADEYGEAGPRLAHLRALGALTEFERFMFPLSGHLVRASRAVVVHGAGAREQVLAETPDAQVAVIPHHAGRPPAEVEGVSREEARSRLGLPASAFLVGQFGFITRPKQPAAVLDGFAKLLRSRPDSRSRGLTDRVRLTGYVDPVRFHLHLKAVDAVVNLRYPSAGEASGTFTRALTGGRAVVVSNIGSLAEVPSDVCLKVEVDGDQGDEVGGHLTRLAMDPAFKATLESGSRAYARTALYPSRCAEAYVDVARSLSESVPVRVP